jgi:hypothetical protein
MAKYMLFITGDENAEQGGDMLQEYGAYTQDLIAAGVLRAGDALEHTSQARRVAVRDGQQLVTDGPFAETKETIGGYYLVECDTIEDAVAWAARCPGAKTGRMDVRPLMELPADYQTGNKLAGI